MSKLKELKEEATSMGIDFPPNITEAKLEEKINDFLDSGATTSKAVKKAAETYNKKESDVTKAKEDTGGWNDNKRRALAKKREEDARKTRIVTVIDNDQRESNITTTALAECSTAYFSLGKRYVPLNLEVELEQGFIDNLKEVLIQQFTAGKDGLNNSIMRPRYTIAYSDKVPE